MLYAIDIFIIKFIESNTLKSNPQHGIKVALSILINTNALPIFNVAEYNNFVILINKTQ